MPDRGRALPAVPATPGSVILTYPGGSSPLYTGSNATIDYGTCNDTTMPPPYVTDHNLDLRRWKVQPGLISGTTNFVPDGSMKIVCQAYGESPLVSVSNLGSTPEPNWNYFQTKAIAGLDPYRPHVDLPLFLFEFKDFPEMLRHAGRVLKRQARASDYPGTYLAYHFGWAPLASDLLTLFKLTEEIEKKKRFLRRMSEGGGFSAGLGQGSELVSTSGTAYVPLTFMGPGKYAAKFSYQIERKTKAWVKTRAQLAGSLPPSPADLQRLSTRLTLGLSLRPAAVWDFVPWTWLIDYFANVGDYMAAIEGQTRFSVTKMCLMHQTTQSLVVTNAELAPGLSFSGYNGQLVVKRRLAVANPTPRLAMRPFLGASQVLALSSLVTARAFKRAAGK